MSCWTKDLQVAVCVCASLSECRLSENENKPIAGHHVDLSYAATD